MCICIFINSQNRTPSKPQFNLIRVQRDQLFLFANKIAIHYIKLSYAEEWMYLLHQKKK